MHWLVCVILSFPTAVTIFTLYVGGFHFLLYFAIMVDGCQPFPLVTWLQRKLLSLVLQTSSCSRHSSTVQVVSCSSCSDFMSAKQRCLLFILSRASSCPGTYLSLKCSIKDGAAWECSLPDQFSCFLAPRSFRKRPTGAIGITNSFICPSILTDTFLCLFVGCSNFLQETNRNYSFIVPSVEETVLPPTGQSKWHHQRTNLFVEIWASSTKLCARGTMGSTGVLYLLNIRMLDWDT